VSAAGDAPGRAAKPITWFRGQYAFLSNFDDREPSTEARYQAAKATDPEERDWVLGQTTPAAAKKAGRRVRSIRPDWEEAKVDVMRAELREKFAPGTRFALMLLATDDAELVEGNNWGDRFWGRVNGEGQNWLGRLLMERREELRAGLAG
jgi:ribA/ribD-fused uncharacterized protein